LAKAAWDGVASATDPDAPGTPRLADVETKEARTVLCAAGPFASNDKANRAGGVAAPASATPIVSTMQETAVWRTVSGICSGDSSSTHCAMRRVAAKVLRSTRFPLPDGARGAPPSC